MTKQIKLYLSGHIGKFQSLIADHAFWTWGKYLAIKLMSPHKTSLYYDVKLSRYFQVYSPSIFQAHIMDVITS